MTASIRKGRPEDLDAIEAIEDAVFDADWLSRRSLRYFLGSTKNDTRVAVGPDGLQGYAMIGFRAGSTLGRVFSLAVGRAHAGQGIGGALLAACEAAAKARGCTAVRLEVRADNAAAIRLYEKAGYRTFGAIADYYQDGTTALRWQKAI